MTRREFLKVLGIGAAGAAMRPELLDDLAKAEYWGPSRYEKHGWYYTLEEMEKIYEQEYNSPEKLLKNIFCRENDKWFGFIKNEKFEVPRDFLEKTLRHLQEMIEKKTAKFLFRLDAFHGHFFVPEDKYRKNYAELDFFGQAKMLVKDKDLGVLFHNSEHLKIDPIAPEVKELMKKRNVVGWYDGRPMEVLSLPSERGVTADFPGRSRQLGPLLQFAAHKDGEFSIIVDGKEIRLDISFDDLTYY